MKALDTFRTPPYRHNCAQAIANHWKNLYSSQDIVSEYAPYVGGRAPEGYCGALFAAMQACPVHAQNIKEEFVSVCGDSHCFKIKGDHRTPCEKCVETADLLVAKFTQK